MDDAAGNAPTAPDGLLISPWWLVLAVALTVLAVVDAQTWRSGGGRGATAGAGSEAPAIPEVRDRIAKYVVWFFGGGLLILSGLIVIRGTSIPDLEPEQQTSILMQVFTAIIGVVGTWVGTVLAFYYSKDNFEAASKQSRALAEQLAPDCLRSLQVDNVMIRRSAMKVLPVPTGKDEDVPIASVKAAVGGVSRLIVMNADDSIRYIIHESMIYRDLVLRGDRTVPGADRTLADLLKDDPEIGRLAKAYGVVGARATLADAKATMERVPGARDVIVTSDGQPASPVVGWVTNNIIVENSRAP